MNNEALVRSVTEAIWNRYELDLADELFAPDYINHDGVIPDLMQGPEAIKLSVALYRRAFPDLHIAVNSLSSEGEIVVLHWTARRSSGLSTDPGLLAGITRSRLAAGKIMESWTEWDRGPLLRELGLLPTG